MSGTARYLALVERYALLDHRVLDLGCGDGRDSRHRLKGKVQSVVGVDIDSASAMNPFINEFRQGDAGCLPCKDGEFDLIVCDCVLEHFEDARQTCLEIGRVLKRGGHFIFRTPNLYHYVTFVSRFTPHRIHRVLSMKVRGLPDGAREPYRTFYRLNTGHRLRRELGHAGLAAIHLEYVEPEPAYVQFHPLAFLLGMAYERLVNRVSWLRFLRCNLFGVFVKQ